MLWFVIPTFTKISMEFSNMVLFCYLYALGGYIRLYHEKMIFPKALRITIYTYIIYVLASLLLDILAIKFNYFVTRWSYFSGGRSVFPFVIAVGIFLYFKSKNVQYNKYINLFASTMFGVYLIHVGFTIALREVVKALGLPGTAWVYAADWVLAAGLAIVAAACVRWVSWRLPWINRLLPVR